jgi:hypothetical protein
VTDRKKSQPKRRRAPVKSPPADPNLRDDFLKALSTDFAVHGVAAIVAYREEKPAEYLKIVASVLPKELPKDAARDPLEDLSDADLLARIRSLDDAIAALVAGGKLPPQDRAEAPSRNAKADVLPPIS